jgi:HK97 family phage major capsid protein
MSKYAEQIAAYEQKRAAIVGSMEAIMSKAAEEGTTLDAEQQEEYDGFEQDIEAIDAHLKRLNTMEKATAATAKPVAGKSGAEGTATRTGVAPAQVQVKKKEAPGVRFARIAKAKAVSKLDNESAASVAERMYGADSETVAVLKTAVAAGSTASENWAGALVGEETSAYADFAEFLRPATILGKFGNNGVPNLRSVPFREPLISQTGGGSGYWVGEGNAKPLTAFDFERTTLEPLKVANIAVLTEENIRSSAPSSELIVRDALRDALTATQDTAFIDPTNSGSAGVRPASITNGAAAVVSTGTDADAIRLDVRALFQKFIDADNPPENGVWIMSTANALALSMMTNALGQREFSGITMAGGTFEGMPVIASRYAGTSVVLANASDIYEADDGAVNVDMSREASLQMDDNPDNPTTATTVMVSLWQRNLVGLRAEREINWKRRRASAVAYLTGVAWGGAVPAS